MTPIPDPPSVTLLPAPADLRARLAAAHREVALLRRLIRAVEAVKSHTITTADRIAPTARHKGADSVR